MIIMIIIIFDFLKNEKNEEENENDWKICDFPLLATVQGNVKIPLFLRKKFLHF